MVINFNICPRCGSNIINREKKPFGCTECATCNFRATHEAWYLAVKEKAEKDQLVESVEDKIISRLDKIIDLLERNNGLLDCIDDNIRDVEKAVYNS